jgi:hypothetical protein
MLLAGLFRRWREGTTSMMVHAIGWHLRTLRSVQAVLFREYILSPELVWDISA